MLATVALRCYIWQEQTRVKVIPRSRTFKNLSTWQHKCYNVAALRTLDLKYNLTKWSVYVIPYNYIIRTTIGTVYCNKHQLKNTKCSTNSSNLVSHREHFWRQGQCFFATSRQMIFYSKVSRSTFSYLAIVQFVKLDNIKSKTNQNISWCYDFLITQSLLSTYVVGLYFSN